MKYPRMTEPTQRVLRMFLDDPTAEKYGLEICKAVGYPAGTVHPLLYKGGFNRSWRHNASR
jgi:hypothetical protein